MILLSHAPTTEWDYLLKAAMGDGGMDRRRVWAARYQSDPAYRLYGMRDAIRVIGLLGVHYPIAGPLEITHVAVHERLRHRHLGVQMIGIVALMYRDRHFIAYTDDDAVGFYRKMGFQIESLGEVYPDRVRYRCVHEAFKTD